MKDLNDLSVHDLAADYKYRGYDRYRAWDQLIIDRGLVPGIDAKDFYKIFDATDAYPINETGPKSDLQWTHFDKLYGCRCEMITRDDEVIEIQWENGHYGGYPPCNPPEEGRYIKINDEKDGK